mgnify:CR=1 FL=1
MKLAMIGLGKMGGNMAERLRRHGHDVVGMDPGKPEADAPKAGIVSQPTVEIPLARDWWKQFGSAELDELPLPYHFDVKPFESIKRESLRDHIQRIGVPVYP